MQVGIDLVWSGNMVIQILHYTQGYKVCGDAFEAAR